MSKAILVMDMPEICEKYQLHEMGCEFNKILCVPMQKLINKLSDKKPDWCPLRPAPEEKEYDYC